MEVKRMDITVDDLELLQSIAHNRGFRTNNQYIKFYFMVKKLEKSRQRTNKNQKNRRYHFNTIKKRKKVIV
jgi:hypothetical protein